MSLLTSRAQTAQAVKEGRFITAVLEKNARNIDQDIQKRMNAAAFKSLFWRNRNFKTNGNVLTYAHLPQHRFVDMKTRQTANGVIRKKRHAIHNRPIFGHANNIVRELTFGFRESILADIKQFDGQKL